MILKHLLPKLGNGLITRNVIPNSRFQILTASDKAANDWFGCSVSISGNVAIVGADKADPGGTTDAGKAYIFVRGG